MTCRELSRKDVFFELGCGKGLAVRLAVKRRGVKRAVGVEKNSFYYESARRNSIRSLNRSQLERTDFWLGDINNAGLVLRRHDYVFNYKESNGSLP